MKKIRKIISYAMLFCFLCTLCMPVIVYAADTTSDTYENQISEYQKAIGEIRAEVTDKSTGEKYDAITKVLFSDSTKENFTGESAKYTIKAGYEVIDEAIQKAFKSDAWYDLVGDMNTAILLDLWKSRFRKDAEAYGIEYGNIFDDEGDTTEEIDNASAKVNLLTWNKSTNADGTAIIRNDNHGVIMRFLKGLESFSGFTTWTVGIAIALTITFGCSTILSMTMDRNASSEALQREFIKILFGAWLIMNFKYFALLIIRIGTIVTEKIMITDFSSSKGKYVYLTLCQSFFETIQATPNITDIGSAFASGIGNITAAGGNVISNSLGALSNFVGGGLVQLASSLVIYAVIIEIGLRYIFTPIAIADLYSEKFRSNGWMWLKKLFAVSIQGAVIFMIIYGVDVLKNAIDTTSVITNTAINLTMIGMFAKSRQIANDIIGVH